MSFDLLERITFLFLVGFFVFSEIYLTRKINWGIVKKILNPTLPIADMATKELEIILHNGMVIKAHASLCIFCWGNLSVGDEVGVTKLGKKYYVYTSLIKSIRKKSNC